MPVENLAHQPDPLRGRYLGKANHAAVALFLEENKRWEVAVQGDDDPLSLGSQLKKPSVPRIRAQRTHLKHVVGLRVEPLGDAPTGAPIDGELHEADTRTASRVSCAMAA